MVFQEKGEPQVSYDSDRQWWGERTEGTIKLIEYAKQENLCVMLKPHIWVLGQGWCGEFNLDTEEEWKVWENNYRSYILHFAMIADSFDVEMICIGTEYRIPARERPEYWKQLIREIKEVYKGEITYAANWDNYENISWWNQLDYIGIDAYFPIVNSQNPDRK